MWRYLVWRLIAAVVVVVGVSFVVFLVLHLTPGDPAQVLLGPRATPDDLARLRQELGLDRPVLIQYLRWASHVLRGDFGRSIMQHRAVLPELVRRFSATLILTAGGVLLAFPLGTLVGFVAAARQGTPVDRLMTAAAMLGVSMPAFWVVLLAGAGHVGTVFSLPGIGFMMVNAILTRDFPLVQGGVLLVAATYVLINLGTDLLYAYVDPRIRYG